MAGGSPGKSIIGFYGSYVQDGSYNVLLEYADRGTLEDYLQSTPPPTTGEDIFKFWSALFNIIQALHLIHNVQGNDRMIHQFFKGMLPLLSVLISNC